MHEILTGFSASVFVLFSGFCVYSFITTPATRHPQSFETSRAKAIYYYGLFIIVASIAAGAIMVCRYIGELITRSIV